MSCSVTGQSAQLRASWRSACAHMATSKSSRQVDAFAVNARLYCGVLCTSCTIHTRSLRHSSLTVHRPRGALQSLQCRLCCACKAQRCSPTMLAVPHGTRLLRARCVPLSACCAIAPDSAAFRCARQVAHSYSLTHTRTEAGLPATCHPGLSPAPHCVVGAFCMHKAPLCVHCNAACIARIAPSHP